MLKGLTLLLALQLLGSLISTLWMPMLPGAIIGMLLLVVILAIRGIDESLQQAANWLLSYLPLLLVVPAAGIMVSGTALLDEGVAIAAALVLSVIITVPLCGLLMQYLTVRLERKAEAANEPE
ncbi:MAG: CidA/LrgA family protein [Pseudomonadaceae bacterium]|nr:CidA/LrgA family protein [Pseudomonadaceae bacterium]|tara:strand:- start:143 stop:511 length:369 start_codon:yes stop_codon:yes gene_type:complete